MNTSFVADEQIVSKIYFIRGQKVMLDYDLATLYNVETKYLKRQVRRNLNRFPEDFMFGLTKEEYEALRSQIGTLKRGQHTKFLPFAFTEQGVAMLSSVLGSEQAIEVNILIIRIFSRFRELLLTHKDVLLRLEQLEKQIVQNSEDIQVIFAALRKLLEPPKVEREPIGFIKRP